MARVGETAAAMMWFFIQRSLRAIATGVLVLASLQAAAQFIPQPQTGQSNPLLDTLREELERVLDDEFPSPSPPTATPAPDRPGGRETRAERLARLVSERLMERIQTFITKEVGPVAPEQVEPVTLEALDRRGRRVDLPFEIPARPLRALNVPAYHSKALLALQADGLTLALYDTLPRVVQPEEDYRFGRTYTDEDARALAAEARLIVSLKGGVWAEPSGGKPVANAVSVRGLDLRDGLRPNGNTTYDDTLFVIIDDAISVSEVHEYRMTTESSSSDRGVGRLQSMQVMYVRGLHRGKDPAYRLKGDAAEGTREGYEGTYQILGANLHSAYAKRPIDSTTPLAPNVSLGCQVVAASKRDFETSLVTLLDQRGIREFPYTIVDGDELAVLDRALAERDRHCLLVGAIPRKSEAAS